MGEIVIIGLLVLVVIGAVGCLCYMLGYLNGRLAELEPRVKTLKKNGLLDD